MTISSKPPSSDLLKKPEKKTDSPEKEETRRKRSPGGQLGHQGKTRKGFGRVDRYEVLKAKECSSCGQLLEMAKSIKIEKQSVAVLVERPIEVVEYQRHHQRCQCCGVVTSPPWSKQIIRPTRPGNKTTRIVGVVRQLWTFTLRQTTRMVMGTRENQSGSGNISND